MLVREIAGWSLILLTSMIAASVGAGGGAITVPVFISFLHYTPHEAAALSQSAMFGSTSAAFVSVILWHICGTKQCLADTDLLLFLMPIKIAGVRIGAILNLISPGWLLLLLGIFTSSISAFIVFKKALGPTEKLVSLDPTENVVFRVPQMSMRQLILEGELLAEDVESSEESTVKKARIFCSMNTEKKSSSINLQSQKPYPLCMSSFVARSRILDTNKDPKVLNSNIFTQLAQSSDWYNDNKIIECLELFWKYDQDGKDRAFKGTLYCCEEHSIKEKLHIRNHLMIFKLEILLLDQIRIELVPEESQHHHPGGYNINMNSRILEMKWIMNNFVKAASYLPDKKDLPIDKCMNDGILNISHEFANHIPELKKQRKHLDHLIEHAKAIPVIKILLMFGIWAFNTAYSFMQKLNQCDRADFSEVKNEIVSQILFLVVATIIVITLSHYYRLPQKFVKKHGQEFEHKTAISKFALLTFMAGIAAGMIGIGGGMLLIPIMMTYKIQSEIVMNTSTLLVLFSSSFATLTFYTQGSFHLRKAYIFILGCFVFTLFGICITEFWIDRNQYLTIRLCFLLSLIIISLIIVIIYGVKHYLMMNFTS